MVQTKEQNRVSNKIYRDKYPDRVKVQHRKGHLKFSYNLSVEEYNSMFNAQNGLCAICKVKPKRMCVDHDKLSGQVRGLICLNCNAGLGQFKDNLDIIGKDGSAGFYLRIR